MKKAKKILLSLFIFVLLFSLPAQAKSYKAENVTAKQIVTELKKSFSIKKVVVPKKKNTTIGEPNSYKTKINFYDKKYKKVYCSIEVFEDNYDAAQRCAYMQALSTLYATFGQKEDVPLVAYRYKNVVIRLNTNMPKSYAKKYYNALKKIVK